MVTVAFFAPCTNILTYLLTYFKGAWNKHWLKCKFVGYNIDNKKLIPPVPAC